MDLSENQNIFPLQTPEEHESYKFYQRQQATLWVMQAIDFTKDIPDYNTVSNEERLLLEYILGFFAVGDALVIENINRRFMDDSPLKPDKLFLNAQAYIEGVHAEVYGRWVEVFVPDRTHQNQIFKMAGTANAVRLKAEWVNRWIVSDESVALRFFAFACTEGIFFSVLFAIIFWFHSRGKFISFAFSNEEISKDEGIHRDYGAMRYRRHRQHGDDARAIQIMQEAVAIEFEFISEILPVDLGDLTQESLRQYAMSVADSLLKECGILPFYRAKNPFPFMDMISLGRKTNFHELAVGNYRMDRPGGKTENDGYKPEEVDF